MPILKISMEWKLEGMRYDEKYDDGNMKFFEELPWHVIV